MDPYNEFWNWFIGHEEELFNFELTQESIFDQLIVELRKVDEALVFEVGPKTGKGAETRDFVISADGIQSAFPAVVSLKSAAPLLERWHVIAFRPRCWPISIVKLGDKRVDPKDVQFSLLDNGKSAGIYLFIPNFREDDDTFKQVGFLMLDEALGEFDVETRLGFIKMVSPETDTTGDRYPLAELPRLFDQLILRLEGRAGFPS